MEFLCWRFQLSPSHAANVVGNTSLQMFLHIFFCFNKFRFRQSSACCLWNLGRYFLRPVASTFLQICRVLPRIWSCQQTAILNL
jgi:hypothetical protein